MHASGYALEQGAGHERPRRRAKPHQQTQQGKFQVQRSHCSEEHDLGQAHGDGNDRIGGHECAALHAAGHQDGDQDDTRSCHAAIDEAEECACAQLGAGREAELGAIQKPPQWNADQQEAAEQQGDPGRIEQGVAIRAGHTRRQAQRQHQPCVAPLHIAPESDDAAAVVEEHGHRHHRDDMGDAHQRHQEHRQNQPRAEPRQTAQDRRRKCHQAGQRQWRRVGDEGMQGFVHRLTVGVRPRLKEK